MSEADAVLWNIEQDPALRSTILCVWVLDRAPDWERFEVKLAECIEAVPRLRQRPVADPLGLAPPRWEDDPHFDLGFHVRRVTVPGEGSLRDLLDFAQPIGMQAFDRDRPLWEMVRVDGIAGGRTGLILKLHHAISDGVGLVRMTEGLVERSAEPRPAAPEPPVAKEMAPVRAWDRLVDAAWHRAESRLAATRGVLGAVASGAIEWLTNPVDAGRSLADRMGSFGRLLAPVSEPLSPVMQERSLSVHYDTLHVPLAELKQSANAVGGTVNDAFVAAVTGGLRRYHEALGAPVEALRMNMPINTRSGENARQAGNQFVPARFAVPVGTQDPAVRMREIHALVEAQRAEPALPYMEPVSAVIGAIPGGGAAMISGLMMKAIDFTTSNVPGPRFATYVSGARIEHMFGFGPLAGAAANVTAFSYDGTLAIGVNVDPAAVRDPALFVECLRKGVDEVLSVI
jgi:WS/DGAT/MGAT family acyltransferase